MLRCGLKLEDTKLVESLMKFFNTAGPINPDDHYFIPGRLDEKVINRLIEQKSYFILHAPRQSGKTTAIFELVKRLNKEGRYKAFYFNVEAAQASRGNFSEGLRTILHRLQDGTARAFGKDDPAYAYLEQEYNKPTISGNALQAFFAFWAQNSEKPLVVFIDEIDSLVGDTLISVLRQLRAGYANRPHYFPHSLCLFGVRDVKDYEVWPDQDQHPIASCSVFNIKAESLSLPDFTQEQVQALYEQHTQKTGQKFTDEAIAYAFHLTQGQPWLVNALAYEACLSTQEDFSVEITKEVIDRAKKVLIQRRGTHLDVLISHLQEPRVCDIVDFMLSRKALRNFPAQNVSYVEGLGLKKIGSFTIANPIYAELVAQNLEGNNTSRAEV